MRPEPTASNIWRYLKTATYLSETGLLAATEMQALACFARRTKVKVAARDLRVKSFQNC